MLCGITTVFKPWETFITMKMSSHLISAMEIQCRTAPSYLGRREGQGRSDSSRLGAERFLSPFLPAVMCRTGAERGRDLGTVERTSLPTLHTEPIRHRPVLIVWRWPSSRGYESTLFGARLSASRRVTATLSGVQAVVRFSERLRMAAGSRRHRGATAAEFAARRSYRRSSVRRFSRSK